MRRKVESGRVVEREDRWAKARVGIVRKRNTRAAAERDAARKSAAGRRVPLALRVLVVGAVTRGRDPAECARGGVRCGLSADDRVAGGEIAGGGATARE